MDHADKPTTAATLERASSLANELMFTVDLQRRRVRSSEPEDTQFPLRPYADLQFLIVALRRLRRTAELASRVPSVSSEILAAIKEFDTALPMLSTMRNVGEHLDDYGLDSDGRRNKNVDRRMLQVASWNGTKYEWLGRTLDVDEAHKAALALYRCLRAAKLKLKNEPA